MMGTIKLNTLFNQICFPLKLAYVCCSILTYFSLQNLPFQKLRIRLALTIDSARAALLVVKFFLRTPASSPQLFYFDQLPIKGMKPFRRNTQFPITVLSYPPKNMFIQTQSPSNQYKLYHLGSKKFCIEAYRISIPKTKLFHNLEIYQWRNHTQFPISKTKYVCIQSNSDHTSPNIQLLVYNEHCPIKLNRIYQMTLAQTLYMLKEAFIGFERLYSRFGAFDVRENMIAVNQKGYFKVWINQNFSVNTVSMWSQNEEKMISSILQIGEKHCQQSKSTRKFFSKVKNCKTFLEAMKEVERFIIESKTLVPTKFIISPTTIKETSRQLPLSTLEKLTKAESFSQQNIRNSILSGKNKLSVYEGRQENCQFDNYHSKSITNQIKRFKSLEKIRVAHLKVSDGETAYTRNYKQSKISALGGIHNSPRDTTNQKTFKDLSKKKRKWLEQSSFVMELEGQKKKEPKERKQMSYSTALQKQPEQNEQKSRKFSANIGSLLDSSYYKFQNNIKKSQHEDYVNQFAQIVNNQSKDDSVCTPRGKLQQQQEEDDKLRQVHMGTIMKNNGWNIVNGFLSQQRQLQQSFHEGHEQNLMLKQFKLEKLESVGRRQIAMSVLPEQYQDMI